MPDVPSSFALYDALKRVLDVVIALIMLFVFVPLLLFIAILVKIDSPGTVFYRGSRTGRGGKPFRIYKFRTMVENAERIGGHSTAENDIRITPVGARLRKHKLDELPQIFNVLQGDMSFVGPRPEVKAYTDLYEGEELEILSIRPGITDLASVKFRNLDAILALAKDPDEHYRTVIRPEKNALRVFYVRNRSFLLDLKILWRTLFSTVGGYESADGISKSGKN